MLLTHTKRSRKKSLAPSSPRSLVAARMRRDYRGRRFEKKVTTNGSVTSDGDVNQTIQWSSEMHDAELGLVDYKTPDGCKGGWTCAQHAPRRGEATRGCRRIKTPDGCKGGPSSRLATLACYAVTGWTCAQHAPRRGEAAMGRSRIAYRYYNPTDGRWTRKDPIGIDSQINLYNLLNINPLNSTDSLGLLSAEEIEYNHKLIKSCLKVYLTIELTSGTIKWKPSNKPNERIARLGQAIVHARWKKGKSIDPCIPCKKVRDDYFRTESSSIVISASWVTPDGREIPYYWNRGLPYKVFVGIIYDGYTWQTGRRLYGEQALPISRKSSYHSMRVRVFVGKETISDGVYTVRL